MDIFGMGVFYTIKSAGIWTGNAWNSTFLESLGRFQLNFRPFRLIFTWNPPDSDDSTDSGQKGDDSRIQAA
jgi:hypothetical protein